MNAVRGKRSLGAVYTPEKISDFMVSLAGPPLGERWNVLEPACADAPFLQAFAQRWGRHHCLTGVELNLEADKAFAVLHARHVHTDYLLWEPEERFDLVIGNPPYGIIGNASHYPIHGLLDVKQQYKQRFQTWHGKYNVYGAFIEHSVHLLREGEQLVLVVPSTWLVLDDFAPLRRFLAERGQLNVHYLGKAFEGVSVVAVVLHFIKGPETERLALYDQDNTLAVQEDHYHGDLICFRTPDTDRFEQRSKVILGDLFQVRFAARSPEYQKSEWVSSTPQEGMLPVLTGRNLKPGWIDYETNYSGLWIRPENAGRMREFYSRPHIVVAHTKGSKVVAALDHRCFAWREDFHLAPRYPVDEQAITNYLNSEPMQEYVKTLYRDLTPHLTRTQLLRLPMPQEMMPDAIPLPKQLQLMMETVTTSYSPEGLPNDIIAPSAPTASALNHTRAVCECRAAP